MAMANTETALPRGGWGGHIWAVVLSAAMSGLAPYFFSVALTLQYGIGWPATELASSYVPLAISLGEIFQTALAPMFWLGIALWFIGCTVQLRRMQLAWPAWSAWGAVTLAVSYVLGVLILYPKSDAGRLMVLVSEPLSLDTAVGIAGSAAIGAILGAFLYALSPKWPGSATKPSSA